MKISSRYMLLFFILIPFVQLTLHAKNKISTKIAVLDSNKWHPEIIYVVYPDMKLTFKLPYEKDQSGVANLLFRCKESGKIHQLDTIINNVRHYNRLLGKYDAILLYNNGKYIKYNHIIFDNHLSTDVYLENHDIQLSNSESQNWLNLRSFSSTIGERVIRKNYSTLSKTNIRGYVFSVEGNSAIGSVQLESADCAKVALISDDGFFEIDTDDEELILEIYAISCNPQALHLSANSVLFLVADMSSSAKKYWGTPVDDVRLDKMQ